MECDLLDTLEALKRRYGLGKGLSRDDVEVLEDVKRRLTLCIADDSVKSVYSWVEHVEEVLGLLRKRFNVNGFTLPKEFASFIANPVEHLKKKLFNYVNDYLSGRIDYYELLRKSSAAVTTSLRTNVRSCYQLWGFATILLHLGNTGYGIAYPEHKFLNFDRSGKQKLGVIPPNVVLLDLGKGFLSFFHEAPRPLSWEDTSDLQKVWSLYTALRPDLMVYGGKVLNIVELGSSPPIKRPNVIIEFKELEDWYLRVRDLKGYLGKPMTAEEWRYRWWQRLREELMKIADLKPSIEGLGDAKARSAEGREQSIRVREYRLILMYKAMYRPDRMFLISRTGVPSEIRAYLENNGVEVYDNVGFDMAKLRDLAHELDKFASYGDEERVSIEIPKSLAQMLSEASRVLGVSYVDVLELALRALTNSYRG